MSPAKQKNLSEMRFVRYLDYRILIETFVISAIVAILSIRLYLKLTDYPIVGNGDYHISHVLWGGFFMAAAVLQFLIFLQPQSRYIGAVLGGLGFGTFIDELGKFITRDNNYFFQPTFAYIYLIFVSIFLLLHLLNRKKEFHSIEYVANSLELLKDAVIHDLDDNEKNRAISYLKRASQNDHIVRHLSALLANLQSVPQPHPNLYSRIRSHAIHTYSSIITTEWFQKSITIFFMAQAVLGLVVAGFVLTEKNTSVLPVFLFPTILNANSLHVVHLYAAIVSTILIVIGVARIYQSRLQAFLMFKRSVLISILIGEVFAFSSAPVRAFTMLVFHLVVLTALNAMIDEERNIRTAHLSGKHIAG